MTYRLADLLECADCGMTTLRKSPTQLYCATCSGVRDRARKATWAAQHPQDQSQRRPVQRERFAERKRLGAAASIENRAELTWPEDDVEELVHVHRVAVPWNTRFSKNALWSFSSRGHVYMRQEIADIRDDLIGRFAGSGPWYEGKVWIDIFVEKPDGRSDAVNVVDLVCDAVKKAIDVDDRWFSIRRLDWSIVKENPRILVGVGQAITQHHRACSYCGRVMPLDRFTKNRSAPLGRSRECHDCSTAIRNAGAATA